jgi:hypothetical protein
MYGNKHMSVAPLTTTVRAASWLVCTCVQLTALHHLPQYALAHQLLTAAPAASADVCMGNAGHDAHDVHLLLSAVLVLARPACGPQCSITCLMVLSSRLSSAPTTSSVVYVGPKGLPRPCPLNTWPSSPW